MIYIIVSIVGILTNSRKSSICFFLFMFLLASSIGAYLVGRQPSMDLDVLFYSLYTGVLLYILFSSFNSYSGLKQYSSSDIITKRLAVVERFASILGILALCVFIYIFIRVFSSMMIGEIIVQEYKNEGGAADVFKTLVPGPVLTISNFISPIGFLFLSLHFHYLIEKRVKKSIKFFLLSLIIVFSGLIALSRSATVAYILVYICTFISISPLLEPNLKKKIVRYIAFCGILVLSILLIISLTRFSDHYTKNSQNTALINEDENPALFSTIDYLSQWEENGPIVLGMHKIENRYMGMYNSCGLAVLLQQKIEGDSKVTESRNRFFYDVFGMQVTKFHGVIARLVYDFGFYGTVVFIIVLSLIVIYLGPYNSVLRFENLLFVPLLLRIACVFFSGNALSSWSLDIAIIFNIIVWIIIKKK